MHSLHIFDATDPNLCEEAKPLLFINIRPVVTSRVVFEPASETGLAAVRQTVQRYGLSLEDCSVA